MTYVSMVTDISSNLFLWPRYFSKQAFVYSGVQKDLSCWCCAVRVSGTCGQDKEPPICPTYCGFNITADNEFTHNTPAGFTLYTVGEY